MNKEDIIKLKEKVDKASKYRYYLERVLGTQVEKNEELDRQILLEKDDNLSFMNIALYYFKENFFNHIDKNIMTNKLEDYKMYAKRFLDESYPFCFNIELEENYMENLYFYALSQGATDKQIEQIEDILKKEKLKRISSREIEFPSKNNRDLKTNIRVNEIIGSTVSKYSKDNLYDVLEAIDDKNISLYIEYIMKNGGLSLSNKIFTGICVMQDQDDDILVSEGNHRIFTYKALKLIKEFVTGKEITGLEIGISSVKGISHINNDLENFDL